MNVQRIALDELVDERRSVSARVGNVFATPEFHDTWWRHFGGGRALELSVVRDGDRVAGVLPLYRYRPGVRRFVGHGGGDELGPVAAPADRGAVAAAMRGTVICEHVTPEWAAALGVREVLREGSPILAVGEYESWDAYLGTRSSNFRGQVRSRTRKLEPRTAFRLADAETLDQDLDTLFRLHRARWQRPSTFGSREAFHRDFARVGLEQGWTRLVVAEVDGSPAAAWYGFRFGGVDAYYQSGRDPALDRDSVGLVLLAQTIRAAFEAGQREYRFLRGDEPYKYRFTDDPSVVVSGVAGTLGAPAAATLRGVRAGARLLRRSRQRARPSAASRADA